MESAYAEDHRSAANSVIAMFLIRLFLLGIVTLVLLIGVAWAFGALWFDFFFSVLRRPLAVAFGLGTIVALAFVRARWAARVAVAGGIALVAAWELTIPPSKTRDWQPQVPSRPTWKLTVTRS